MYEDEKTVFFRCSKVSVIMYRVLLFLLIFNFFAIISAEAKNQECGLQFEMGLVYNGEEVVNRRFFPWYVDLFKNKF
jgi:hypothetical protein